MTDERTKFKRLTALKYKEQAVWFMNGFWGDGIDPTSANDVFEYFQHFIELDKLGPTKKGADGNELDQFWSAKFLEDMDKAITALQRKEALKAIDFDQNGKMSLIEYLCWKYKKTIGDVVTAPQGDNAAAIKAAQEKLDAVMKQLAEVEKSIAAQKQAVKENEEAQRELAKQEQELKVAEQELQVAIEDLNRQEAEYKAKIAALEETIAKESGMKQAKAKNELSQLKGEDPLPLRRAKITQEAALRKVKKQQAAVAAAKEDLARKAQALAKAIKELEESYVKLEQKMGEAREELERVKARPGGGKGALYFMDRELFEADKYLPTARMKYDHSKPYLFKA